MAIPKDLTTMKSKGWAVVVDGEIEKVYPYRLQAIIHCYEKGYVWTCRRFGDNLYSNDVRIVRREMLD